jgi:hypothetical protein
MRLPHTTVIPALAIALAIAGCGQSAADKASKDVCNARADIQKQVSELKAMSPSDLSIDKIKSSLTAIRGDVTKIVDAQSKLSDKRKQGVQTANDEFKSQVSAVVAQVVTGGALSGAQDQVRNAITALGDAYTKALRTSCP